MKTTGQILKENRERKGITLNEVSLATKISVKVLTAIEEGQSENLPTKTFLRGFVRAYARYLSLDEDAILNSFYEEMGSTKPKVIVTPDTPGAGKAAGARALEPGEGNALAKYGAIAAILLLVGLIVIVKNKADSYKNEAVISELPKEIEVVNPPASESEAVAESTPAGDSPTPDASPAEAVAAAIATPTPSATSIPTPTATPKPSPTVTPSATPKPSPSPGASPSATPSKPTASKEIIVEAMDTVEIEAQVDDEPARKIKLSADQVQAFKVSRKVLLRLSDGGAVNLIVNGKDRGVPGDLGKPIRIELP